MTKKTKISLDGGFFPLWRKITSWGWYTDSNTKAVFLHLLLTANYKESHFLGHRILPGQCVSGRQKLSISLGLSEQEIRTALKHLKSTNELTSHATNRFTIYTLTNFHKYTPFPHQKNEKSTSKQPASNQQATTSNKDKKDNKEKNKTHPHLKDSDFEGLWRDWLDTRKKKKVPNTSRALELALDKLHVRPLGVAILMLKKAIECGWSGIYDVKDSKGNVITGTPRKPDTIEKEIKPVYNAEGQAKIKKLIKNIIK